MSERYKKLYSISDNLYVEGSPVIILAGNLLKDSYTDRIIVQVKYKNIQEKIIKALKVRVSPFSVTGHPLESNVDFQYLDLNAGRDGEFGSKTAIVLPNATTRQFQICITEVVFLDNSIWTANESVPWVSQRTPLPLSSYLNEFEILKQYRISFPNANYIPTDAQGLWYCCCGAINESGERHCHSCHANKTELFEKLNIEYLVAEKESRLAAESAVASALALKKKQNTKKATILIASIAVILIFIASVYFAFTMLLQPYLKYTKGLKLLEAGEYTEAIEVFTQLKDYKDSEIQLDLCIQMASEKKYNEALLLYEQGCYAEAIEIFAQLKGYKDSEKQIDLCNQMIVEEKYNKALLLYQEGKYVDAMGIFISLSGYKQSLHYLQTWNAHTISAGGDHTLAVSADGTVLATINTSKICITPFYNIEALSDIVSVSEGYYHANALKSDGTVVYMGNHADKYYNDISNWNSVVAIASGKDYTIGLKSDGTVLAVGVSAQKAIQVSDWSEIIAISVGATFEAQTTVGLKANGTVVAVGDNTYGQCNVSAWSDIIAISAGPFHTVGLKKDGSVIATTPLGAYAQKGQCDVSTWENIVSISAGDNHTVGLKADGTVVATGDNYWGQCDVQGWTDIVAISAGTFYTVGLKNDGTLVVAGKLKNGQCNVSGWQNIKLPSKDGVDNAETPPDSITPETEPITEAEQIYRDAQTCAFEFKYDEAVALLQTISNYKNAAQAIALLEKPMAAVFSYTDGGTVHYLWVRETVWFSGLGNLEDYETPYSSYTAYKWFEVPSAGSHGTPMRIYSTDICNEETFVMSYYYKWNITDNGKTIVQNEIDQDSKEKGEYYRVVWRQLPSDEQDAAIARLTSYLQES